MNTDQKEIVLPSGTSQEEVDCLVKVAQEFELIIELGDKV